MIEHCKNQKKLSEIVDLKLPMKYSDITIGSRQNLLKDVPSK